MNENIKLSKYTIADGNPTLLIWGSLSNQKSGLIDTYLRSVDQIGFVSGNSLEMMGNELCVNATIALASTLGKNGSLKINALNSPIQFNNNTQLTTIKLPLNYKKENNIILLDGIGFKVENLDYKVTKSELKSLADKYSLPAFGIILLKVNQIFPYIYVKGTDSLKAETACGSGSIATSIFTGLTKIKQPTGEIIDIKIGNDFFEITSKVKEVSYA